MTCIKDIGISQCEEIHRSGVYRLGNGGKIDGLHVNHSITHSVTFSGSTNNDGKCTGYNYKDPYGSWKNVIVTGSIKVTLARYTAELGLDNDKVFLKSGTVCRLSEGSCIYMDGGYTC